MYMFNCLRVYSTCLYTRSSHSGRHYLYLGPRSLTCNIASHFVILGFQLTRPTCLNVIPSPGMSLVIVAHLVMLIENEPMCCSYHWDTLNIRFSGLYWAIGSSRVHVISFMDLVLNIGCIYQPWTHGQGHHVDIPMSFDTVFERPISRKSVETLGAYSCLGYGAKGGRELTLCFS